MSDDAPHCMFVDVPHISTTTLAAHEATHPSGCARRASPLLRIQKVQPRLVNRCRRGELQQELVQG